MFIKILGQHVSILIESSIVLEGPEDDSIRIETCCLNTLINIVKVSCVGLTYHCKFILDLFCTE